jgi:apolipoprotein N-acyltransferase
MLGKKNPLAESLGWTKSFLWVAVAVVCFHLAYTSIHFSILGLFIFGYAYGLVRLTDQPSVRRAFYFGLATGYLCYAPQLFFMWRIFSVATIVLWLVLAFWVGLFTAIICGCLRRWGKQKAVWLVPVVWTGIEYFRSELYYLKFSWLNVGYVFPNNYPFMPLLCYGMYGVGFLVFALAAMLCFWKPSKHAAIASVLILPVFILAGAIFLEFMVAGRHVRSNQPLTMVGIQTEFPTPYVVQRLLDQALAKNTNASIFVLSEYTLDGPVPDSLKNWCREHSRFLVIGGKDPAGTNNYFNTAFVVGTNGQVVFKQAKRVPIQFFHDGLPAPQQNVWNSPCGKIGLCVCYDLSYTLVTDELVREGAQLLIVPTMDVDEWGRHQHELHSRIAPVRAAEYGIPIFRLASSGVSQAVDGYGQVFAHTSMPGNGEIFAAKLQLPIYGSRPPDRFFAPLCVALTSVVLVALLMLTWREKRNSIRARDGSG